MASEAPPAPAAPPERCPVWQPIATVPRDRYVLLFNPNSPDWDGNMDVGRWFGDDEPLAGFWSCGGPNGGLELEDNFTHWMPLPDRPNCAGTGQREPDHD